MTPIHRKHQQRPAAQLAGQQHCQDEAQVMGKSGGPAFRAAKHKQFWLRQDGPPQLQFCLTAALQRRACSCFGQAPARSPRRCPKLLEKGQARSGCLRPQAQIQGPKKRAVSRPQKWGREMDPAPAVQFGTRLGGETATPKLGPFGGPSFGAANSSIFGAFQTATLRRLWPTDKHSTWKEQLLRTTTSAGSFLVEVINMRETCTGEAHTPEARIA